MGQKSEQEQKQGEKGRRRLGLTLLPQSPQTHRDSPHRFRFEDLSVSRGFLGVVAFGDGESEFGDDQLIPHSPPHRETKEEPSEPQEGEEVVDGEMQRCEDRFDIETEKLHFLFD